MKASSAASGCSMWRGIEDKGGDDNCDTDCGEGDRVARGRGKGIDDGCGRDISEV